MNNNNIDIIGIGAGPANLSLAALSSKHSELKTVLFEKQNQFKWHPGMLLPNSKLQVSYLKDLVTLVDPTNAYSFLNYLFEKGALYQFITADFPQVSRLEFNDYLSWVFNKLPSIYKDEEVKEVNYKDEKLYITTSKNTVFTTKNLVLGTGLVPYIPDYSKHLINDDIFHNTEFLFRKDDYRGKRVAIIGGGQSGAEIVQALINDDNKMPESISWFSRRSNFSPIDNSPFANELFTPIYTNYFFSLPQEKKESLLQEHKLASDGISEHTVQDIYRRLYEIKFVKKIPHHYGLFPSHEMLSIKKVESGYQLTLQDIENNVNKEFIVDKVILCTGYKYYEPDFLAPISSLLHRYQYGFVVNSQYKIQWEGEQHCGIYLQNGSKHAHGIADPNLSLLAFRSATILNDIRGQTMCPKITGSALVNWV